MGRPSLYSPELLDSIVERLSAGEPMAQICREEGMPAARTVRDWINQRDDVSTAIARAREDGEDWLAAECLLIADTPMEGIIEEYERVEVEDPDIDDPERRKRAPKVSEFVLTKRRKEDMLGHRKLQIETRLKLLAKWNPRKYGENVNVTGHVTLEQLVAGSMKRPEQSDGEA